MVFARWSCLLLLFLLGLGPGATWCAEGRVEAVSVGELEVEQLRAAVAAEGTRAIRADGSIAAEIWLAKDVARLEDGAFLGAVRLTHEGRDVRERAIPPGTYTLRYSALPAGDRHGSCMPNPEFAVLLRTLDDTDVGRRLTYDEMVNSSAQASGRRHPVVWQVSRGRGHSAASVFREQEDGIAWIVVPLSIAGSPVPLSVHIRGSLSR